jgi:hypothetical protein
MPKRFQPIDEAFSGDEGIMMENQVITLAADIDFDPILPRGLLQFRARVAPVADDVHYDSLISRFS